LQKLTQEQRDKIALVLESIFHRPELLIYMREQLIQNFWSEIKEWEDDSSS